MNNLKNIKGIIFDYGSALDVSGRNWLHPIHQAYASRNIEIPKDILRRGMAEVADKVKSGLENSSYYFYTLKDFFLHKAQRQIAWLNENYPHLLKDVSLEELSKAVAHHCYEHSRTNVIAVGNILRDLAKKYRLALVSNFHGNLEAILEDFGVKQYFAVVTTNIDGEQAKTSQELLAQTIKSMGMLPRDILVVGDSISRDIIPATTLGCRTAWLQNILPTSNAIPSSNALPTSERSPSLDVLPKNTIRLKSLNDLKKLMIVRYE